MLVKIYRFSFVYEFASVCYLLSGQFVISLLQDLINLKEVMKQRPFTGTVDIAFVFLTFSGLVYEMIR